MARFVNDQAVLRRGDGPFRPFGGAPTLRGLLFSAYEPGFTFEPWDITTLYQDRAGTTPVTAAGQSVGLRLDKSQGLRIGPELVTNGTFDTGITGWASSSGFASTAAIVSGEFQVTATVAYGRQIQAITCVVGRTYRVTCTTRVVSGSVTALIERTSSTGSGVGFGPFAGTTSTSNTTLSMVFIATSTTEYISVGSGSTGTGQVMAFDNISVRELAGNHQVAVSDAKRGVYGWMPKTGRRNLLTYTEQFDNAAWAKTLTTVATNSGVAPDGSTTAEMITPSNAPNNSYVVQNGNAQAGTLSFYAKKGAARYFIVVRGLYVAGDYAVFDLQSGTITQTPIFAGSTASIVSIGSGWYRCILSSSQSTTANAFSVSGSPTGLSVAAPGGILIWGAQLEVGSTATAYQRVVSQYDITEAGVPTCYYVQADGVDDAYVTPTITPNTDKVQVFAGVRKLSDATTGIFAETSLQAFSSNGSFVVGAPDTVATYSFGSTGSLFRLVVSPATFASPTTNVITGLGDIAGDTATLRINGTQVAQSTSDQGTGNYLAYPAYIYGRGGTSFPFNGLDFGHAVRFGPNLDAATIARVESLIARNTPEVTL